MKYKRFGIKKERLKDVYTSIMRSILEYSVPAYNSQLTQFQKNLLEKIQKRALRLIYGFDKTYEAFLDESKLETLETRREKLFKKFAQKKK